jgi:muramoyltetrapeptide carboxypeptidase
VPTSKIHLISPAGSCKPFFVAMSVTSATELIVIVQAAVGANYVVTGNKDIIEAGENELAGGRNDDQARADDLQQAFQDEDVSAIVLLRGGAWFTRVIPHIDFSVLANRNNRIAVFGFSELTTLVNIVGAYPQALGIYDMGPAFLTYGLKRYAAQNIKSETDARGTEWAKQHLLPKFNAFFKDVISMIEGSGTVRTVNARLLRGQLADSTTASFVGGNLTVLSTLVGSKFDASARPRNQWLMLEDFNDKLERIDRFLSHLTLAGYWDECQGLLLGDFHKGYEDLGPALLELLNYHLPQSRTLPILESTEIGHVWPMAPLPLHTPLDIIPTEDGGYTIHWAPEALRTVKCPSASS